MTAVVIDDCLILCLADSWVLMKCRHLFCWHDWLPLMTCFTIDECVLGRHWWPHCHFATDFYFVLSLMTLVSPLMSCAAIDDLCSFAIDVSCCHSWLVSPLITAFSCFAIDDVFPIITWVAIDYCCLVSPLMTSISCVVFNEFCVATEDYCVLFRHWWLVSCVAIDDWCRQWWLLGVVSLLMTAVSSISTDDFCCHWWLVILVSPSMTAVSCVAIDDILLSPLMIPFARHWWLVCYHWWLKLPLMTCVPVDDFCRLWRLLCLVLPMMICSCHHWLLLCLVSLLMTVLCCHWWFVSPLITVLCCHWWLVSALIIAVLFRHWCLYYAAIDDLKHYWWLPCVAIDDYCVLYRHWLLLCLVSPLITPVSCFATDDCWVLCPHWWSPSLAIDDWCYYWWIVSPLLTMFCVAIDYWPLSPSMTGFCYQWCPGCVIIDDSCHAIENLLVPSDNCLLLPLMACLAIDDSWVLWPFMTTVACVTVDDYVLLPLTFVLPMMTVLLSITTSSSPLMTVLSCVVSDDSVFCYQYWLFCYHWWLVSPLTTIVSNDDCCLVFPLMTDLCGHWWTYLVRSTFFNWWILWWLGVAIDDCCRVAVGCFWHWWLCVTRDDCRVTIDDFLVSPVMTVLWR